MDGGNDRVLNNVMGSPIYTWDARGTKVTNTYDTLQRLLSRYVYNSALSVDGYVEYLTYGEGITDAALYNLRGRLYRHYDQAGRVVISQYSFKGEPKITTRTLIDEYKYEVSWPSSISSRDALLESDTYTITTITDALGRVKQQTNADGSISKPEYHLSGRLNKVTTKLKGATSYTEQVSSITYNPKGQRIRITYGNGTRTDYTYEETTHRLKTLVTTRTSDSKVLQNISYTYDPAGNITIVNDASIPAVFSNNQAVEAKQKFTYDALYRLITAEGREHTSLNNPDYYKDTNAFKQSAFISITDPNDDNRLANYTRYYTYDKAGNMLTVQHVAANSARSFTRTIRVDEDSNRWLPANMGNNLTINDYYDANGNIQELETLLDINWNYRNQLRVGTTVQRTTAIDDGEYYLYDSAGNRVRKKYRQYVNVYSTRYTEKVYIGNVEIKKIRTYSTFSGYTTNLKRTTLHIMDDTRRIASVHNWSIDGSLSEINSSSELNTNKIRYQYGNHIDSASLELSSTGSIISYEEYFPYGDTCLIAGTAQKEVKLKEYRYTGKEKDDVTGLYYYGARYYASWLGRWMSADPLFRENPSVYDRPKGGSREEAEKAEAEYMQKLYSEGLNLYGYVKGNPVRYSDPTGNLSWADVKEFLWLPIYPEKGSVVGQTIDYYKNKNKTTDNTAISDNNLFIDGIGSPLEGYSLDDITKEDDYGGKISSPFGKRNHPTEKTKEEHGGIDIVAPAGTDILAVADGTIRFRESEGYGYQAIIDHGNGVETLYAHMSKESYEKYKALYSGKNNYVSKGQKIGEVGKVGEKGKSTGEHLHFAVRSIKYTESLKELDSIQRTKDKTEKGEMYFYYETSNFIKKFFKP